MSTNIPLIKVHRPSAYNRLIWQYDKADWDGFNEALLNNDWNPCFVDIDVDVCASRWTDNFINLARTFIPNKMTIIDLGTTLGTLQNFAAYEGDVIDYINVRKITVLFKPGNYIK